MHLSNLNLNMLRDLSPSRHQQTNNGHVFYHVSSHTVMHKLLLLKVTSSNPMLQWQILIGQKQYCLGVVHFILTDNPVVNIPIIIRFVDQDIKCSHLLQG